MSEATEAFLAAHPLRIDLPNGESVRFRDLKCAARTALDRRCEIWDEANGRPITLAECNCIVNGRSV